MNLTNIVPIIRSQFKGPSLRNPVVIEMFISFMQKELANIEKKVYDNPKGDDLQLTLLYLEGCFLIHPQAPELAEAICKKLVDNYEKLTPQNISRITQALCSQSNKITNSPQLKTLMTRYIKENYSSKSFPKDVKQNIARVVEIACLDVKEFKEQIMIDLVKNPPEQ